VAYAANVNVILETREMELKQSHIQKFYQQTWERRGIHKIWQQVAFWTKDEVLFPSTGSPVSIL